MTDEIFALDSNVLVDAYDESEPKKREQAKNLLARCWKTETKLALSTQNLSELYWVVSRKAKPPLSNLLAKEIILSILNFENFIKIGMNAGTVVRAIDISEKSGVMFWDALLAATMEENGIFRIYTENIKDFSRIEGIKAVNPFKTFI